MNLKFKTTSVLTVLLLLGGCSYWDTEPEVTNEVVVEPEPAPGRDVGQVIYERSNGSVQLFNLDDDTGFDPDYRSPAPVPQAGTAPSFNSGSLTPLRSGDPSVEVYPFGDVVYAQQNTQPLKKPQFEAQGQDNVVVYFGHDSVALNTASREKIAEVASRFKSGEMGALTIEGHASVRANYPSETTRQTVNLRISMNRAFNVAKALIDSGVPAEAIKLVARGDTVPPSVLNGKTPEEASRRVEISD